MATKIKSSFMAGFKLCDNVIYNISIMRALRTIRGESDENRRRLLRKPIILLNVSMIEALLYDFHKRVKWNTREGVSGLPMLAVDYIRGKRIDKLESLIASSRKHDLFDDPEGDFYTTLEELRRIRNRMHIQNEKNDFESDDRIAFSEARLVLSEQALEYVMKTLQEKYPREVNVYTADFELPWDPYFP